MQGAYRTDLVYQRSDLEAIVDYAADRAVRVVPEVDMPVRERGLCQGRVCTPPLCSSCNNVCADKNAPLN
eukprot:COSAG01_NODE_41081_length_456_cov_0.675070_1_plen_70_part_00